ncbi:uncharacterized protein isoform X1 [Rhodnius prolixus]|uniref:uncharacterized protein isoform X1 n=1 Tax=Rhodnius prolixus TaxID=13249 RepID=UPI003D18B867
MSVSLLKQQYFSFIKYKECCDCVCPDEECPWCTFAEECEEPNPAVLTARQQFTEPCLKQANYDISKTQKLKSPLLEFDQKMKQLMQLGKPSSAQSVAVSETAAPERPTLMQRLASQPFRTVRNIQQKIQMNNIYVEDYPLFEALGHITDAEELMKFEGALRAAELATRNAPPEEVEAAAVKGASAYRAQVTQSVNIQKNNLVEVVGYMGITRPQ